jgi:hypothetical protein
VADDGLDEATSTDESGETGETGSEEQHGSIRLELRSFNDDLTVFDGTTEVTATVQYESCLQDFYLNRMPNYQQDGLEGAVVFEAWADRLCSAFDNVSDCEVTGISQNLIEANSVYSLSVTMQINDASSLSGREIHVGPLPLPALADCSAGQQPSVEVRQSGLIGKDAMGVQIWRIHALPAANVAVADQATPLRIDITAN